MTNHQNRNDPDRTRRRNGERLRITIYMTALRGLISGATRWLLEELDEWTGWF